MMSSTSASSFKVGYQLWVLWLIIVVDVLAATLFFVGSYYPFSEEIHSNPHIGTTFQASIFLFLFGFGAFMSCHLYTVVCELRRDDYAIKVDKQGIHLWRASKHLIPWKDIDHVEVFDRYRDSRYIIVALKGSVKDHPSPYLFVNLFRFATLGRYVGRLKMFLDGVACDNQTLRNEISKYSDKLVS